MNYSRASKLLVGTSSSGPEPSAPRCHDVHVTLIDCLSGHLIRGIHRVTNGSYTSIQPAKTWLIELPCRVSGGI